MPVMLRSPMVIKKPLAATVGRDRMRVAASASLMPSVLNSVFLNE